MVEAGHARALWASGLGVRHGRRWIFRDVEVGLGAGRIVRLSGPAASGKSTLLRVLAGAARPSAGLVRHRPPVIGFVPERFAPPGAGSVEGYLVRLARLRGLTAAEASERARGAAFRYGLQLTAVPAELNGDEQRRLAFAQATLDRPSLLVLDELWGEPNASPLDFLAGEVRELAEAGCVVLFTDSHNGGTGLPVDEHLSLAGGILFAQPEPGR
jgi:ABC-type multidrug transport system ATPase subunit